MFQILRVNMASRRCTFETIPPIYIGMGGRGLVSAILSKEVPPGSSSLTPHNKLVFAPGLLTASPILPKKYLAAGSVSPVTGGLKTSISGGLVAHQLMQSGILGLVIEDTAPQECWLQLEIRHNEARLSPSPIVGLGNNAAIAALQKNHGNSASHITIGPAGENRLPAANIAFSGQEGSPLHLAGQGGMGAVMGSRGLKSISVIPTSKKCCPMHNLQAFDEAAHRLAEALNVSGKVSHPPAREANFGPTEPLVQQENTTSTARDKGCLSCRLCDRAFATRQKKHTGKSAAYTALWGMETGESHKALRAQFDLLCNDMGVDSFAISAAALEALKKGTLQREDIATVVQAIKNTAKPAPLANLLLGTPGACAQGYHRGRATPTASRVSAAFADTVGICTFAARAALHNPQARTALVDMLQAQYGWDLPANYAISLGPRILELEEAYNSQIVTANNNCVQHPFRT